MIWLFFSRGNLHLYWINGGQGKEGGGVIMLWDYVQISSPLCCIMKTLGRRRKGGQMLARLNQVLFEQGVGGWSWSAPALWDTTNNRKAIMIIVLRPVRKLLPSLHVGTCTFLCNSKQWGLGFSQWMSSDQRQRMTSLDGTSPWMASCHSKSILSSFQSAETAGSLFWFRDFANAKQNKKHDIDQ